ncbi:MAG: replicative DNA helicase [Spirochaetaceae bacterium]|jgi:replicative DNA helicase|nr:replicative DNA helicase [Spirochaetaceae bacterium]
MNLDKIPPHDAMAEQSTLGALLLDGDAISIAIQYLRAGDFYSKANALVYDAILNLFNNGVQADILTVTGQLRQGGNLDQVGGPAYIASLTDAVPSSANIEYYAQRVQDCSLKRALIRVSHTVIAQCYDESQDARMILEETQQRIFELNDRRQTFNFKSAREVIQETIHVIERIYNTKKEYTGVPSGFDDLDRLTSGFQQQELIIIGARPSMGKTALALSMAANMAIHNQQGNIPVAFFTLEMSDLSLMLRIVSSESGVESNAIRTGFIKSDDFDRITEAASSIYDAPLYIVDKPNMKLLDLRALARRLRIQQKVEIIFIDYLTLISSENPRLQRHEQIAEISRSLKSLARELNIPVIALSQLTREAERDRPNLSSIRESGAIEQDADVVIFLHRERDSDQKIEDQENKEGSTTHLILAKQRNGPVGTIDILFKSRFTKFVPLTRQEG